MQPMSPETAHDPRAEAILEFWFRGDAEREEWFRKDPSFDDEIRARFLSLYEEGARGALAAWRDAARSCLALIVLLDQFPRNMFRGSARAYATDALALDAARHALASGHDRVLGRTERTFIYLPFEHSENLADQERALELFAGHANHEWARRHYEIVKRFGRFPHRNAILGRHSTPAEIEFLKEPGSSF
jgi:uncharacterized protein (DUF924 family)